MKKFLMYSFLLLTISLICLGVVAKVMLAPKLKELIETKGSEALGAPVHLAQVDIEFWPPITLELHELKTTVTEPMKASVDIPLLKVSLDLTEIISQRVAVLVQLDRPHIGITLPEGKPDTSGKKEIPPAAVVSEAPAQKQWPFLVGAKVKIAEGEVHVTQGANKVDLKNLKIGFNALDMKRPFALTIDTRMILDWAKTQISLPIKLKSDFTFEDQVFATSGSSLDLGGLEMLLTGKANLITEEHSWNLNADIVDLAKLPVPPAFLPPGKWSGAIGAKIHTEHSKGQDWVAKGNVKVSNLQGQVDFSKEENHAKGPLSAHADVDFYFKKTLTFNKILASGEMKDLALGFGKQFAKPAGVPFNFNINASQTGDLLTINTAKAQLATLNVSASGSVNSQEGKNSDLQITVPRTSLVGFEKFFPAMAGSPLQGFVEVKASINGDLKNTNTLSVNINPLLLEGVKGKVQWVSADKSKSVSGPASIDAKAVIVAKGKDLKSAQVNTQIDLTGLEMSMGEQLQKKAGSVFKLNLVAKQKGPALEITKSQLVTSAGVMKLSGNLKNPSQPDFNVRIQVPELSFAKLSAIVPMLSKMKLDGNATGDVSLWGQYDFAKGVEKSPLNLKGKISAQLPQFIHKSPPKVAGKATPPGKSAPTQAQGLDTKPPEPILPNWPLMKNMSLETTLKIGHVEADDLILNTLKWNGRLQNGMLTGTASIGEIFSGSVVADKIQINLLEATPTTSMNTVVKNLDIAKALTWSMPEYKDLASGRGSGQVDMRVAHPSRKDFLEATWVSGSLNIVDGYMSTLPFDQFINAKLTSLPGLGGKNNVKTQGVRSNIDSQFEFTKGQVNFKTLHALTPDRNELQSSGWIRATDKAMDLKGNAYLATAAVPDEVKRCNSDASGRLVIPVHFTGNVMKPDLNLAGETASLLISRTASCKVQEFKKEAESKLRNEAQKQIESQKGNLQEEAKKRLQGLFGK